MPPAKVAAPDHPSQLDAPQEPGSILAPGYVVLAHLHRGEWLDVYDLWGEERHCRCVGKVVCPGLAEHEAAARTLLREGRLLLRLTHPHIVRAYDVRRHEPLVIIETLPGATLAHLVDHQGPLPREPLAHLGLHLASALTYLHGQRMLHLDLTPANIIASQGLAKLIDLSVARRPGRSRVYFGTDGYRAPEQRRDGMLSTASDVFGLGAILRFAATGIESDMDDGVPDAWLRQRGAETLPDDFWSILATAMATEQSERPSLDEVATCLANLL